MIQSGKINTLQTFLDQNAQQLSVIERKANEYSAEIAQVRLGICFDLILLQHVAHFCRVIILFLSRKTS
jgi:hypothetical protein